MQPAADANLCSIGMITTTRWAVFVVGGAFVATLAVLAATLSLVNDQQWWRGFLAASVASALAAAASLMPLIWGLRRAQSHQRMAGFFAASGFRMAISLGACLLAVRVGGYPPAPTLLLMVVYYFAVLTAEAALVVRSLWNARD